jgi:hypothetical protein
MQHVLSLFQTYSVNTQTPDSASTASAMFSGVKTNYETFGFDNSIVNDDPYSEAAATKVETILKWAQDAGMDTGTIKAIMFTVSFLWWITEFSVIIHIHLGIKGVWHQALWNSTLLVNIHVY